MPAIASLAALFVRLNPVEDALLERRGAGQWNDLGVHLSSVRREAAKLNRVLVPLAGVLDQEDENLSD